MIGALAGALPFGALAPGLQATIPGMLAGGKMDPSGLGVGAAGGLTPGPLALGALMGGGEKKKQNPQDLGIEGGGAVSKGAPTPPPSSGGMDPMSMLAMMGGGMGGGGGQPQQAPPIMSSPSGPYQSYGTLPGGRIGGPVNLPRLGM